MVRLRAPISLHRDLADLVQGHRVDDEGDDGRADNRQDDQEHEDLLRRRGDQLGDEDFVHVGTRIGFEVFPAPDVAGYGRFIGVRGEPQQDHIHRPAARLAGLYGLEQSRYTGAVERRIGGSACAFIDQRIVVLEELHFLRIAQRHEDHRVTSRRHHAAGQADHRVLVPSDTDALPKAEAGLDIGNRLVVRTRDRTSGDEVAGLTGVSGLEADEHHPYILALIFDLHRQVGDIAGLDHPLDAKQRAIGVVAYVRGFGVGAERIALHDP